MLNFYDSRNKSDGTPADEMVVYAYLDADEYFNLVLPESGVLPVTYESASGPGYIAPGEIANYAGTFAAGSYVTRYDSQGRPFYSLVADGELRMTRDADGIFNIEMDFVDTEGDKITGSYHGPVRVESNAAGDALSTISSDFTMDLSSIQSGNAIRNGGSMSADAAGNWQIELLPEFGVAGDGMTIEICTGKNSDDLSTIAGTYTADITGAAGTFVMGQWTVMDRKTLRIDAMQGTGYVGDFSLDGLACSLAPALGGTIEIADNGDGTFTITMTDLIDDNEPAFSFSGSWTGTLTAGEPGGAGGYMMYAAGHNAPSASDGSITALHTPGTAGGTGTSVSWRL